MGPGPELDAEIARKVFGAIVILDTKTNEYSCREAGTRKFVPLPPYSTNTTTAHQLVQLFKKAGCVFIIKAEDDSTWKVTVSHPILQGLNLTSTGPTLPYTICHLILQFNSLFKIKNK